MNKDNNIVMKNERLERLLNVLMVPVRLLWVLLWVITTILYGFSLIIPLLVYIWSGYSVSKQLNIIEDFFELTARKLNIN